MSVPLLLHSLDELREVLLRAFDAAEARTFVEIGSETGTFTRDLLAHAHARGGTVTTVEPRPAAEIVELAEHDDALRLVRGLSPAALAEVGAADAWVIDGDHNHWTVTRELEAALDRADEAGRPALIVLHDAGWPCARRDFYYAPDALPPDSVHSYTWAQGVVPDDPGVVASGLRGEGDMALAMHEGGERNGVLTAIEDVMAARGGLELALVPAIYGVAVVFPADAPWAAAVRATLAPYDGLELLRRMEANRVALYLRVVSLQDRLSRLDAGRNRALAELSERVGALEAENMRLRLELARGRAVA